MKVFVAGATGAIGRRLVPALVDDGHEVTGMTARAGAGEDAVRALGAEPVVADGLDAEAVRRAVFAAEPEVVVHEMTGLGGVASYRNFDRSFELTNRLRTTGLDNLLDAATAVGARRFVAQSFGNWNYAREGGPVKTEADPLRPDPPATMSKSLGAIRYLERAVLESDELEGVVLRYANLYGPGASMRQGRRAARPGAGAPGADHRPTARASGRSSTSTTRPTRRRSPWRVAPPASTTWPTTSRLPPRSGYRSWRGLRRQAAAPGSGLAGPPARGGGGGVDVHAHPGRVNAKAKRELGWALTYPSWRDGFRHGITATPSAATPDQRSRAHARHG